MLLKLEQPRCAGGKFVLDQGWQISEMQGRTDKLSFQKIKENFCLALLCFVLFDLGT